MGPIILAINRLDLLINLVAPLREAISNFMPIARWRIQTYFGGNRKIWFERKLNLVN